MFLDSFDVLISKMNFKNERILFWWISEQKSTLKKQPLPQYQMLPECIS